MLEMKAIETAQTEWAAPIVFIPKKNRSLWVWVDYWRLKGVTIRDSYPIPRMNECIYSLGAVAISLTLDANNGYWKMEVDGKE